MSEFAAILQLVATVATAAFEVAVDFVCCALFASSLAAIWRIPEIIHLYNILNNRNNLRQELRKFALGSVTLSCADIITLPLTLIALLSPLRWKPLFYAFDTYSGERSWTWDTCMELRGNCCQFGCLAVFDMFCWLLGCFTLISPLGRVTYLITVISGSYSVLILDRDSESRMRQCSKVANQCSRFMARSGFSSLVDFFTTTIPIIVAGLVPSVWPCFYKIIMHVRRSRPVLNSDNTTTWNARQSMKDLYEQWDDLMFSYRLQIFLQLPRALIDLLLFLFFVLAFLSPLRNSSLRRLLGCCSACRSEQNSEQQVAVPSNGSIQAARDELTSPSDDADDSEDIIPVNDEIVENTAPSETITEADNGADSNNAASCEMVPEAEYKAGSNDFDEFDFHYSIDLRFKTLQLGTLALGDLFLLPMLLPLFLFQYRFRQLYPRLQEKEGRWGMHELYLVASQCGLQFLDILLVPTLPLLFCTALRWAPVWEVLSQDECFLKHSFDLYGTVIIQLELLLLDIVLLPITLLVLATHYRAHPLHAIWRHPQLWRDGVYFHCVVLSNFVIILHDALLMAPALAVCCIICPYRALAIHHIITDSWQRYRELRQAERRQREAQRQECNQSGSISIPFPADEAQSEPSDAMIGVDDIDVVTSSASFKREGKSECDFRESSAPPDLIPQSSASLSSHTATQEAQIKSDALLAASLVEESLEPVPAPQPGARNIQLAAPPPQVDVLTGLRERLELWKQALWTVIDLPFEFMALVILCSLWRTYELYLVLYDVYRRALATTSHRWQICRYRESNCFRREIAIEFLSLLRDALCVFPMIIIFCTFWRAMQLLTAFTSKLFSRGAILENPAFTVEHCHCDFPDRGGPSINLQLRRSVVNDDTVARDNWVVHTKRPPELHILSSSIWENAAAVFGAVMVSIVKSYTPVPLVDETSIGWTQFVDATVMNQLPATVEEQAVNVTPTGHTTNLNLWLRLDFGTVKRTTLVKKLRMLRTQQQLCIQIEAPCEKISNATGTTADTAVLVRMSVSLAALLSLIEQGSGLLPEGSISSSIPANELQALSDQRSNRFVNTFHVIILQVTLEWFLDVAHFVMFFVTIISPVRWLRLVVALFEPAARLPVRLCDIAMRATWHLDRHLLEFRSGVFPLVNELLKQKAAKALNHQQPSNQRQLRSSRAESETLFSMDRLGGLYFDSIEASIGWEKQQLEIIKTVEAENLRPYRRLRKNLLKNLAAHEGCSPFLTVLQQRLQLHDRIIFLWFQKAAAKYRALVPVEQQDRSLVQGLAVVELCCQAHDDSIKQLTLNRKALTSCLQQLRSACFLEQSAQETDLTRNSNHQKQRVKRRGLWKRLKLQCGLFGRSLSTTRMLILQSAVQALTDVGFALLFCLLILTLLRAVPLLRDMYKHRTLSFTRYTSRMVLIRHVSRLAKDIFYSGKFILFSAVVLVSVGGIPAFLRDLVVVGNIHNLRTAAHCAQQHAKDFLSSLLRIISLLFKLRTYRILFKSVMYCILVPGACIAEAVPFIHTLSTAIRFSIGMVVWMALLLGAILITVTVHTIGARDGASRRATNLLLIFGGVLFAVLVIAMVSVANRAHYISYDRRALSAPRLTWSHIFALITGPLESLQLCAVLLYFFWANSSEESAVAKNLFSSQLLLWAPHGGGSIGYNIAGSVAAALVILWGLLVSVPLAVGGTETARRQAKVLSFKSSPLYECLLVFISRLLTVWIIATLMRPASCYSDDNDTVLTTEPQVRCGGGDAWYADSSIALLAFFIITSAVMHADDADLLQIDEQESVTLKISRRCTVKFAPLYAMAVRSVQLFVCAACMGGFKLNDRLTILVPVASSSFLMALFPLIYSNSNKLCSFSAVVPIRSAGFVCVAWTAIVCALQQRFGGLWEDEITLYIGWTVIFFAGAATALISEWIRMLLWRRSVRTRGLTAAIDGLLGTFQSAIEVSHQVQSQEDSLTMRNREVEYRITHASGVYDVTLIVASIESEVLFEKLSSDFLKQRSEWLQQLQDLGEETNSDNEILAPYPIHFVSSYCCCGSGESEALAVGNASVTDYGAMETGNIQETQCAPAFTRVINTIAILKQGLQCESVFTDVSRIAFTILLTNRGLPQEVCWLIYSYLVDARFIREILMPDKRDLINRLRDTEDPLTLLANHGGENAADRVQLGETSSLDELLLQKTSYKDSCYTGMLFRLATIELHNRILLLMRIAHAAANQGGPKPSF